MRFPRKNKSRCLPSAPRKGKVVEIRRRIHSVGFRPFSSITVLKPYLSLSLSRQLAKPSPQEDEGFVYSGRVGTRRVDYYGSRLLLHLPRGLLISGERWWGAKSEGV